MNESGWLRRQSGRHRRRFPRLWVGFTMASSGDGLAYGAVPLLAVVVNPHPLAVSAVAAAFGAALCLYQASVSAMPWSNVHRGA